MASSWWWVPRSTMTPRSSTMISSAPMMVDSRWAMTSVVRFSDTRSSASWISRLGVAVERRGRLVEQQDRRRLEDGAGDGDALLLAARELEAALAHLGVVALGREPDEIVDLREPRRLLDLGVARLPAAVADVVADGVVEQHGVLRHHADRRAQRFLRDVADVLAVDGDAPAADLVEAEQQARDGRLAGAGGSDDRHRMPGGNLEADALEDFPLRIVGKRDILEAYGAALDVERLGARACP